MTTERKRWWRKVAAAAFGGTVVVGGLFGIVRATAPPQKQPVVPVVEDAAWTRTTAPAQTAAAAPSVAEVERTPGAPGFVTPASATLPVPAPAANPVAPALPIPLPAVPPSGIEPAAAGPRAPGAGLVGAGDVPLPPVPVLPTIELPKVPSAPPMSALPAVPSAPPILPPAPAAPAVLPPVPVTLAVTPPSAPPVPPASPLAVGSTSPVAPAGLPALPSLPISTAEPPKAPIVPVPPAPAAPSLPPLPQPAATAPSLPPVQPVQTAEPMLPEKPDSGLNPTKPGNTLNPTSPVVPATPIQVPPPVAGGRETPGTTVDRPKPPEPSFGPSDKFVFPVPAGGNPLVQTPRDPAMLNLKHTAALAVLGGAMLSAEQARSAAPVAFPTPIVPAVQVKADDEETKKLKRELEESNKKVADLDKQVKKLTELLLGKKDDLGYTVPSDPGAIAEIKRLKDQVKALETELGTLKTQTSLRPVLVPEAKPKGIVKVVNEYPVEISMVINDKSHRIAPNTKIEVEVPAGDFSYQLLQSGAPATRSVIKDKETVTLRIK